MSTSIVLVAASPLAKIFQRRWTVRENGKSYTMEIEQLADDPKRVFLEEEFSILVPFSNGAEQFWHGIPQTIQDPLKRDVLTGGSDGLSFQDYQWTGIVELRIGYDVLSQILASAAGSESVSFKRETVVDAIQDARLRATARCLEQARRTYRALKDQREKLLEHGNKATYTPSVAEFLCAYVLKEEEDSKRQKRDNMRKQVDELIGQVESANATNKTFSN